MKGIRALMPMLLAVAIALMPFSAGAASQSSAMKSNEEDVRTLLRKSSQEQGTYFARMVNGQLKYVTTRSFVGKEGPWLGFIEFYSQYKDGESTGYVLERASVQFGMQGLPRDTQSCTLYIGERINKLEYNSSNAFAFNFPTSPTVNLSNNAANAEPKFFIVTENRSFDLNMKQAYPGSNIPGVQYALTAMAPAYVDYVEKNGSNGGTDHSILRLRSYVSNSESLARSYTWELTLVHGASLPCKATVIRYDCSTEKISISQRELRSYFS